MSIAVRRLVKLMILSVLAPWSWSAGQSLPAVGPTSAPAATLPWQAGGFIGVSETNLFSDEKIPRSAANYWTRRVPSAGRIAALREARNEAMHRLAGRIMHVYVTPQQTLEQFLSGQQEGLDGTWFLAAARPTAVRYWDDLPIVAVRVEVPLRSVYLAVISWLKGSAGANPALARQLEQLVLITSARPVVEIGMGAVPRRMLDSPTDRETRAIELARNAPQWISLHIAATGKDLQQARRNLAVKIGRLALPGGCTVRDFTANRDGCGRALIEYLQHAEFVEPPRGESTPMDGQTVRIRLWPLWDMIIRHETTERALSDRSGRTHTAPVEEPTTQRRREAER